MVPDRLARRLQSADWLRGPSPLRQLLQDSAKANAALAGQSGGFRDRAVIGVGAGKTDADLTPTEARCANLGGDVICQ